MLINIRFWAMGLVSLVIWGLLLAPLVACAALPEPGEPGAPADARYCGEPARDKHGVIKRSTAQKARFMAAYPMPQDGQVWYVDHVIPLDVGGCDLPFNMQWLPARLKTCAGYCKDRWERVIYLPKPLSAASAAQ
jgi:hypothetical protein